MPLAILNAHGHVELSMGVPTCEVECITCDGTGEEQTYDHVPYGDGDTLLVQTWDCDVCEGRGYNVEVDL